MIKDRLQIARGSAARITSFLNSFRDYEIIFNTDTNRLGIVLPNKTIVYIGAPGINDAFEEGTYIESIEVDSESPNVLNIIRKPIPNPDLELNDNTETSGKYISKIEVDGTNKHKLNITKKDLPQGFSGSYNDLTDKPTIPTKTSDLTNDSGFLTTLPTHNHYDKADLVDGKVPLEQLPPIDNEITKEEIEAVLTGDITSHNHTTEINEHNSNENAHSDIRQLISDLQDTVDDIETIIGSIDGEEDADNVINKLHEIVNLLNGYAEGTTLVNLLNTKADTSHNHTLSEITDYVAPTIPTISTSITTDATDDTKTASPKAVKTYVDNAINSAILGLLGGES